MCADTVTSIIYIFIISFCLLYVFIADHLFPSPPPWHPGSFCTTCWPAWKSYKTTNIYMRISWLYSLPLSASALYNLLALLLPLWKDASKPSAKDLVSRSISVPARLPTEQVGVGLNPPHWMPWLPWSCSSSYQNENATFLFWHGVSWFVWQTGYFISWLALGFLLSSPFSYLTPTPTTPSVRRILVLLTYNLSCFLFSVRYIL